MPLLKEVSMLNNFSIKVKLRLLLYKVTKTLNIDTNFYLNKFTVALPRIESSIKKYSNNKIISDLSVSNDAIKINPSLTDEKQTLTINSKYIFYNNDCSFFSNYMNPNPFQKFDRKKDKYI